MRKNQLTEEDTHNGKKKEFENKQNQLILSSLNIIIDDCSSSTRFNGE